MAEPIIPSSSKIPKAGDFIRTAYSVAPVALLVRSNFSTEFQFPVFLELALPKNSSRRRLHRKTRRGRRLSFSSSSSISSSATSSSLSSIWFSFSFSKKIELELVLELARHCPRTLLVVVLVRDLNLVLDFVDGDVVGVRQTPSARSSSYTRALTRRSGLSFLSKVTESKYTFLSTRVSRALDKPISTHKSLGHLISPSTHESQALGKPLRELFIRYSSTYASFQGTRQPTRAFKVLVNLRNFFGYSDKPLTGLKTSPGYFRGSCSPHSLNSKTRKCL